MFPLNMNKYDIKHPLLFSLTGEMISPLEIQKDILGRNF